MEVTGSDGGGGGGGDGGGGGEGRRGATRRQQRREGRGGRYEPEAYERAPRAGRSWDGGEGEGGSGEAGGPHAGRGATGAERRAAAAAAAAELLPVKTLDGELALVKPALLEGEQEEGERDGELPEGEADEGGEEALEWESDDGGEGDPTAAAAGQAGRKPLTLAETSPLFAALAAAAGKAERRAAARLAVAEACLGVVQAPESGLHTLREVLALCGDGDPAVAQLATLSLAAVFRDILPAYRVVEGADEDDAAVSKEVAATRAYEQGLLRAYRAYIATLHRGVKDGADAARCVAAAKCAGVLCVSAGHFNYRKEVVAVLVRGAASRVAGCSAAACASLRELFRLDTAAGEATLDAVVSLARAVRGRGATAPAALVRCLAALEFDDSLNSAWGELAKDRAEAAREKKRRKKKQGKKGAVDADTTRVFKEAEAQRSLRAKAQVQSKVVEAAFEVYFRILKEFAAGKGGGGAGFEALEAALAGLAKQARYINVDFMADLFKVLFGMLPRSKVSAAAAGGGPSTRTLPVRVQLRMVLAIHAVLVGQGNALQVDQAFLVSAALSAVQRAPFVGGGSGGEQAASAGYGGGDGSNVVAPSRGQGAPASVIAVDVLQTVVGKLARGSKVVHQSAAHTAAGAALHAPAGAAVGSLAALTRALAQPGMCDALLGSDDGGVEASLAGRMLALQGAESGQAMWELPLLARHYHPAVRNAASSAARMKAATAASVVTAARHPHDACRAHDDSRGAFNPPPCEERKGGSGARKRRRGSRGRAVAAEGCRPSEASLKSALKAAFKAHG